MGCGLGVSHEESWTAGRGKELCCTIIAEGEVGVKAQWWEELLLFTSSEVLAGLDQPWTRCGFKAGRAPVGDSNGLRPSAPVHPNSSNLQESEINLSSDSQGSILFLVNLLSYMMVMFDNYMRQVTVQTVKIQLLLETIQFHNETQFKQ